MASAIVVELVDEEMAQLFALDSEESEFEGFDLDLMPLNLEPWKKKSSSSQSSKEISCGGNEEVYGRLLNLEYGNIYTAPQQH